jgi:hypothetical protein
MITLKNFQWPEVDIPVTAGGCQVSRGVQKGRRGIWQGEIKARGISKGKKGARGLRHVYQNLYMCI